MKKPIAVAFAALLCLSLSACGASDEESAAASEPDSAATEDIAASGEEPFAEFLQGSWKCEGYTPYVEAHIPFPAFRGVEHIYLSDARLVIDEDTITVTEGDEVTELGWSLDGRTMALEVPGQSDPGHTPAPGGTQLVENVPETREYAVEPVDMTMVGGSNDDISLRIWTEGERTFWVQNDDSSATYSSSCVKS